MSRCTNVRHVRLLQKFVYCTDGTIRTNENLCLVAGETIHKAGSWSARDLAIEDCEKATESLRQWSYTEIGGNRVDHGTHNCSTKPACTAGCSSPVKSSGHRVQQRLPLLVAVGLACFVSWYPVQLYMFNSIQTRGRKGYVQVHMHSSIFWVAIFISPLLPV